MKKILFAAFLMFAGVFTANADDRERPINIDQLPKNAQAFLAEHFNNLTVAFAVENLKYIGAEYEVVYTDRTEVDFSADGEWESVERKYDAIPTSIIPAKISDYVANMGMSGQYIKKIERGRYTWEIELSNGLEIKFDKQFNVIGYDD